MLNAYITDITAALRDSTVTATDFNTEAEAAGVPESESQRPVRWSRPAIDTVPPDPRLMMPLAPGQQLTMKPQMLEGNYWENGLIHVEKNALMQQLDSMSGINDSTVEGIIQPTGIAGDPVPYQFCNDSIVTSILMVSFFLMVWVVSLSRHFLKKQVKNFFFHRQRENLFAERTQNELRGQLFLIFQTCFLLGILFFDYSQEYQTDVFNQVSPYKMLLTDVGICCLYYMFKMSTYSFVNNVFFNQQQCEQWSEAYLLCVLAMGVAMLPLALLVVYFDLSMQHLAISLFCVLVVDKLLLLYKCSRIFFNYRLGFVHLFLYFCTLEITPIFILFRALVYANSFLLTIN